MVDFTMRELKVEASLDARTPIPEPDNPFRLFADALNDAMPRHAVESTIGFDVSAVSLYGSMVAKHETITGAYDLELENATEHLINIRTGEWTEAGEPTGLYFKVRGQTAYVAIRFVHPEEKQPSKSCQA